MVMGFHSFGDEARLDFLMRNEVPQSSGNPAARIASYLQRGNNGFGLKFLLWITNANNFI